MNDVDPFIEVVSSLCKCRQMFVPGGTFYEVCAYLTGYARATPDCPLSGEKWSYFNGFICATLRFPDKYIWPYVIRQCSRDDDEATGRLLSLLTDFIEQSKSRSYKEIVQDARKWARGEEEGEPVRAWRKLSRAIIHRARREEIELLIQEHSDSEILWSATFPEDEDVATLLDKIQESYIVSVISGSEKEGEVTIITPDLGPVGVKLVEGSWRVDASKIIDCWKANRDVTDRRLF